MSVEDVGGVPSVSAEEPGPGRDPEGGVGRRTRVVHRRRAPVDRGEPDHFSPSDRNMTMEQA